MVLMGSVLSAHHEKPQNMQMMLMMMMLFLPISSAVSSLHLDQSLLQLITPLNQTR